MSPSDSVAVEVPATTANLGPGFDCLGLALDIHNTVELTLGACTEVIITGAGQGQLPLGPGNLVLRAAEKVASEVGIEVPGWHLRQHNEIPLARGLGSSSAAIVGGLVAANELLGAGLDKHHLLQLAAQLEGHPDNVAPALYGGLTACCVDEKEVLCLRFDAPEGLAIGVVIPNFEVSTEEARAILPEQVSFDDAVFNTTRAVCTMAALVAGKWEMLGAVMDDRLHQPYRMPLLPGMAEVIAAAGQAGAYGAALSGSGPSVVAFAQEKNNEILEAMVQAFRRFSVGAVAFWTCASNEGAVIAEREAQQ